MLLLLCTGLGCHGIALAATVNSTPVANDTALGIHITPSKTHQETLSNGLTVIIREDHRAPVAMTQIWYKVGSTDETGNNLGISHALEHMMFKGTSAVPNDEFSRISSKFGGATNAFTSANYTGYYQMYPARYMPLALELEADRMTNLQLRQQDFEPEIKVVMEERRQRTDDNPKALAYERFRWMAYPTSPLRQPIIGHMKNLQNLKLDDLKAWYKQWYSPNNAVLIIVGDVDPTSTMNEVRRYFGDKKPQPLPTRTDVNEFQHMGERTMDISLPVQVPALYMAWNVDTLSTTDNPDQAYALTLLQEILDGGMSARFETRLVRDQRVVSAIGTSYDAFSRGGGLFTITAIPEQGKSLEDVRTAILQQIEQLKTDPISADELARIKTNYLSDLIYSQDSVSGQAQLLGRLAMAGLDHSMVTQLPKKLDQLSVDFLQHTAKEYLVPDNLSTLYLRVPTSQSDSATQQGEQ